MTLLGGGARLTDLAATGYRADLIAVAATCATKWAISPSFALIRAAGMGGKAEGGALTGVGGALDAFAVDRLATWRRTARMTLSPVINRIAALEVHGLGGFEAMAL